jgi:hypothetical protein
LLLLVAALVEMVMAEVVEELVGSVLEQLWL